jgi:TRAP-type transport system small permease protein
MTSRIDALLAHGCKALEFLIALALAAMVVLVFGNVVLRYAFDSGITMSEELARWLFVWLTFLGAIVALNDNAHLGSDVLTSRLGPTAQRVCRCVALLAMLGINALLLQGSWQQAVINANTAAPVSGLPVAIFYASGVVFAVAATVILLRDLWRCVQPVRPTE